LRCLDSICKESQKKKKTELKLYSKGACNVDRIESKGVLRARKLHDVVVLDNETV
jgi:hypothetical protein